jgi:predicted DNA-binding transcriptional regulator AlpA
MANKNNRLLRLPQVIGQKAVTPEQAEANRATGKSPRNPRQHIEPLLPISRSAWWAGIKTGKYPQSVKLTSRTTCWLESDILALINQCDNPSLKGGSHD